MVTQEFNDSSVQRFRGLSTDAKPTGCDNGSVFIEIDTSMTYLYNASSNTWCRWKSNGSESDNYVPEVTSSDNGKVLTAQYENGEGTYSWQTASGGNERFIVHATQSESTATLDKSYSEIVAAINAEKEVVCILETTNYGISVMTNVSYVTTWDKNPVYFNNSRGISIDYLSVRDDGTVSCTTGVSLSVV